MDRERSPFRAVKAAVAGARRATVRLLGGRRPERRGAPAEQPARAPAGIGDRVFVGRVELIRRILSTIHNNSILLRGEPGVGKTSVLLELDRRLTALDEHGFEFHPVYVDLEGVPECRLFGTLAQAVLRKLDPDAFGQQGGGRGFDADSAHRELACGLRRVLISLGKRRRVQVRIVLLIDGIDALERCHPRTAQRLRGLFMTSLSDSLVMVASAVEISKRWDREGSPWYNFFEEIELGSLAPEDARAMIEASLGGVEALDIEAVERIVELTECHPRRIKICCDRLTARLREQGRETIEAADVELVGSREPR
jgi:hypothetical protein